MRNFNLSEEILFLVHLECFAIRYFVRVGCLKGIVNSSNFVVYFD